MIFGGRRDAPFSVFHDHLEVAEVVGVLIAARSSAGARLAGMTDSVARDRVPICSQMGSALALVMAGLGDLWDRDVARVVLAV